MSKKDANAFLSDDDSEKETEVVSAPKKEQELAQEPPPPKVFTPKKKEFKHSRWGKGPFTVPSTIPLSERLLPPITRKRSATYRLVGFDNVDQRIQPEPGNPLASTKIMPPPQELYPTYKIYDPFETDWGKREKVMRYLGGTEVINKENPLTKQMEPVIVESLGKPIIFNGEITVDIQKEYGHYVWWERHPENGSNKFRNPQVPARFIRVDTEYKTPHLQMLRMDLGLQAQNYVMKLNTEELINVAAAMTEPTIPTAGVSPSDIRLALRYRAMEKPEEVMFKTPDAKAMTHLNVIHSLEMGIIDFNPEQSLYVFEDNEEGFFRVPISQNPVDALVSFLVSDEGAEDKAFMEECLSFWK